MIIIFGWKTKGAIERPLLDTHCYRCNRATTWDWFRLTEWFTGFFVPLLPMKNEHELICQGCGDRLRLSKNEVRGVKRLAQLPADESQALHDRLVQRLEDFQLADKTETQRQYWKNRRQP